MTGFINVNKAEGVSSAREVAIVKRCAKKPCGHLGTLDPMASGVLPVAVGNACRLFDYFLKKRKTYFATFKFGEDYDTLDITGNLLAVSEKIPSVKEIEGVIPSLVGEVMQIPPKYSAKSVNGRRGYQLARAGVEFDLPAKKVSISYIKLIKQVDESSFGFEIGCGGGTYIRSIVRDMAKLLGTYGAMSALVRTKSGCFDIGGSVCTDILTPDNIRNYLIPCDEVIEAPSVYVGGADEKKLLNGVAVKTETPDGEYKLYVNDKIFYGLATVSDGVMKVRTKLC